MRKRIVTTVDTIYTGTRVIVLQDNNGDFIKLAGKNVADFIEENHIGINDRIVITIEKK